MRPGSGPGSAAATTDGLSGPAAAASGSACPRLTGGAIRFKDLSI